MDLDEAMLARYQATRLRDIVEAEQLQDDADAIDDERERRDLERSDRRERSREKTEDALKRRKAELEHAREMRKIERKRSGMHLSEEIRAWKELEKAEREKLKAEGAKAAEKVEGAGN